MPINETKANTTNRTQTHSEKKITRCYELQVTQRSTKKLRLQEVLNELFPLKCVRFNLSQIIVFHPYISKLNLRTIVQPSRVSSVVEGGKVRCAAALGGFIVKSNPSSLESVIGSGPGSVPLGESKMSCQVSIIADNS